MIDDIRTRSDAIRESVRTIRELAAEAAQAELDTMDLIEAQGAGAARESEAVEAAHMRWVLAAEALVAAVRGADRALAALAGLPLRDAAPQDEPLFELTPEGVAYLARQVH